MCKQLLLSRYYHWAALCFMTQNTYESRANSFYINITTLRRYAFLFGRNTFFCVKYRTRILRIHASSNTIGGWELRKGTVMIWEDSYRPRTLRSTWLWGQEGFFFCEAKASRDFHKRKWAQKVKRSSLEMMWLFSVEAVLNQRLSGKEDPGFRNC